MKHETRIEGERIEPAENRRYVVSVKPQQAPSPVNKFLLLAGLFAVLLLSGCDLLKTQLGSPAFYWNAGFWPTLGAITIVLLLLGSLIDLLEIINNEARHDGVGGSLIAIAVSIFVLQLLPEPDFGLRIVPTSPLAFRPFAASVLSGLVWIFIVLGFLIDINQQQQKRHSWIASLVLASLGLNAMLSLAPVGTIGNPVVSEKPSAVQTTESNNDQQQLSGCIEQQLARWANESKRIESLIRDDLHQKTKLESQLKSTSTKTDSGRKELEHELRELNAIVDARQKKFEKLQSNITIAESKWRRIQRLEQFTSDSVESESESSQILHSLSEELRGLIQRELYLD